MPLISPRDVADRHPARQEGCILTAEARQSLCGFFYLLTVVYAFLAWNYSNFVNSGPGLQCTAYNMNFVIGVANLCLPAVILIVMVVLRATQVWQIQSELIATLAIVAVSSVLFAGFLNLFSSGQPELRQTIKTGSSQIQSYREDGFLGPGPLLIQQEFPVASWFIWVTPLFVDGEDVNMKLIDRHHIFCRYAKENDLMRHKPAAFTLRVR